MDTFAPVLAEALSRVEPFRNQIAALPREDALGVGFRRLLEAMAESPSAVPSASTLRAAVPALYSERAHGGMLALGEASEAFEMAISLLSDAGDEARTR